MPADQMLLEQQAALVQQLAFSTTDLVAMNAAIALMMFGVSLQLRLADFQQLLIAPRAPLVGLVAQFLLLPAITCLLTWLFAIPAGFALGMILVASCPGGTFSNIMTWLARGNVAVSVTMTAVSSIAAMVMTPFNFALYGHLNPITRPMMRDIAVDPMAILALVALVLVLPILLGMTVGRHFPRRAAQAEAPMRWFSLAIFMLFIMVAVEKNLALFFDYVGSIILLVIAHNLLALGLGFGAATLARLPVADRRAVTLEVGIQNSGLGLMILFVFYPQAGGMILITALWGVWHLLSGLALSQLWARQTP